MSQNTFPRFTNMIPAVEDMQLVVDSLREEDRNRITRDGIFTPGIVNEPSDYLSNGTSKNSLKIKPFVAYTLSGNRIEVSDTWDNLYASGNIIPVSAENNASAYLNIPMWYSYSKNYTNLEDIPTESDQNRYSIQLATLGKGSILHGIKVRTTELFNVLEIEEQPTIYITIGTQAEPEKFLPPTIVSNTASNSEISIMNLMYSASDQQNTDIMITFVSESVPLTQITSGNVTINLCIANLSGFDNEDLNTVEGGTQLSTDSIGTWLPSTTYHIVVRYKELESNPVSLTYTDSNGTTITTPSENTRITTNYEFYALRKSGSIIDYTTSNDVKLGEIQTDINGDIYTLNINGTNPRTGANYTEYLTIPGYRYTNNIDASQIADGSVTNEQFQYLSTLSGNVQSQLNSKADLEQDNTFTGKNVFTQQIDGDVKSVNGFSAYATPTANSVLVLDNNGKIPAEAISESTVASIGNFYTVSSGVLQNGRSSFLQPNTTGTGVVIKATSSNPLVLNYPDGTVERITQDQEVGGLAADGFYYLVKELNGNYIFLPTSGGTKATIPVVSSGNSFRYEGQQGGTVSSSFSNSTAYLAFDGNTTTGTQMGSVTYKNYNQVEETGYLPNGTATYIQVNFPVAISPTGFAACFRQNETDVTPKAWIFEGRNSDSDDWTQIYTVSSQYPSTWNIGEIKTINTPDTDSYKQFRLTFNVNATTINNYMAGEETDPEGITMPIKCYYLQIYANNTSSSAQGSIVEGYVRPSNMTMGSYFLDISKKPYTGYKCAGASEFTEQQFVKLGFVQLTEYNTGNQKLTVFPFCYNTFTISDPLPVSQNTPIVFNHNLGVTPNIIDVQFQCRTANNGYSVGDIVSDLYCDTGSGIRSVKTFTELTVTTAKMLPSLASNQLKVYNKAGTSLANTSNAQWNAIIYCSRGW